MEKARMLNRGIEDYEDGNVTVMKDEEPIPQRVYLGARLRSHRTYGIEYGQNPDPLLHLWGSPAFYRLPGRA